MIMISMKTLILVGSCNDRNNDNSNSSGNNDKDDNIGMIEEVKLVINGIIMIMITTTLIEMITQ